MNINRSFYFIRHGETNYNVEQRFQGSIDAPLNDRGIEQAYIAAENIINANIPIDIIVSSQLKRAVKTAEVIAEKINKPIIVKEGIAEKGYGILEGTKITDLPSILEKASNTYIDPTGLPELEGSEKYTDFKNRVVTTMNEILNEFSDKNILFVAHTTVYCSLHFDIYGNKVVPENAKPFLFEKTNDNWEIKKL